MNERINEEKKRKQKIRPCEKYIIYRYIIFSFLFSFEFIYVMLQQFQSLFKNAVWHRKMLWRCVSYKSVASQQQLTLPPPKC